MISFRIAPSYPLYVLLAPNRAAVADLESNTTHCRIRRRVPLHLKYNYAKLASVKCMPQSSVTTFWTLIKLIAQIYFKALTFNIHSSLLIDVIAKNKRYGLQARFIV